MPLLHAPASSKSCCVSSPLPVSCLPGEEMGGVLEAYCQSIWHAIAANPHTHALMYRTKEQALHAVLQAQIS